MASRPPATASPSLLNPRHPERVCWGCSYYCPADDLRCGNGTVRTQHPLELFGPGWNSTAPGAGEGDK